MAGGKTPLLPINNEQRQKNGFSSGKPVYARTQTRSQEGSDTPAPPGGRTPGMPTSGGVQPPPD